MPTSVAFQRIELYQANKAGNPLAGRGQRYLLTGSGSTDDIFNFGSAAVLVQARCIFVESNLPTQTLYLFWGSGPLSGAQAAQLGDFEVAAGANALVEIEQYADWVALYGPAGAVLNNSAAGAAGFTGVVGQSDIVIWGGV